jgi:hypothetical protein
MANNFIFGCCVVVAENYRPISLTSVCCKIMEHILASKIMKDGEENNILYPLQHGFQKGHSCEIPA